MTRSLFVLPFLYSRPFNREPPFCLPSPFQSTVGTIWWRNAGFLASMVVISDPGFITLSKSMDDIHVLTIYELLGLQKRKIGYYIETKAQWYQQDLGNELPRVHGQELMN
jgi:hypothetical protein